MGIEEGTCWDEHWVLYGNQFDNKFDIKGKKSRFYTNSREPNAGLELTDRETMTLAEVGRLTD